MKLGRVAIDGSKLKANASKHKAMSYGRMKEKERELRAEVRRLLGEAQRQDDADDRRYGKDRGGDELPEELRRRDSRLKRIREAKRALEEEARQETGQTEKGPAKPADKKQYNFTDPESRIMKGSDGFVQGYNCQIVVEENFQLIVGQAVTQQANDKQQLKPMIETVQEQAGQMPEQILADSGYCSQGNLKYLDQAQIDGYVATERQKHGEAPAISKRGPLPKGAGGVERMKRKLQTQKWENNLCSAQEHRGAGIWADQAGARIPAISVARDEKVQTEWALVCLTHNILKMYRICCT